MNTHSSIHGSWTGLMISVLLLAGMPTVSADASIALKDACKDLFLVGTAINRSHATGANAGRRSLEQVEKEIALIKTQFNQITAENDMKWEKIHPREGPDGYHFGPADSFVKFGEMHGLHLVGHTLVWHNQTPDWVFGGTITPPEGAASSIGVEQGYFRPVYAGPRASREELLGRMRDHIHAVVGRYKGKVKTWDVVNEAIADGGAETLLRNSLWLRIIGPDYIAKAFQFAHEADPDAILRYNDYGLEDPVKAQKLVKLIKSLQEQKVPIHAIGTQAHLNSNSASYDSMDRSLTEIATLGLPIHITELDISGANCGDYESVFRAILKHLNSVKLVTFWGVNDAVSWLRDGKPLLFDANSQPKPAFNAVISVVKEQPLVAHDLTALHDAKRVLANPHKGWYHHFPDNHINKYRIKSDADLLAFPGMDHLYLRLAWSYLEPREGQFDWAILDGLIEKWTKHGLGISFRISCKETSTDRVEQQYATPRWVMEAGAKGDYYRDGKPAGSDAPWEPAFDDPIFLQKLENFLRAFAARYDGKPWLRYVDIGSIGDWGEGHTWAGSRKEYGFALRQTHVDLHLKHFRQSRLMISDDFIFALSDPDEQRRLHRYVLDHGISYRDDSILVDGYLAGTSKTFTVRSPEFFADAYPDRPTVLELEHYGSVKQQGNWDARPDSALAKHGGGLKGPDFFRGALDHLHATYIGYHGDAREWLADNPALTGELLNRCGYWYFLHRIELPDTLRAGESNPATLVWENRGVAPAYHAYQLKLRLEGPETIDLELNSQNRRWLPMPQGETHTARYVLDIPKSARPGRYTLKLKLYSPEAQRDVFLALNPKLQDGENFYKLGMIDIVE